MVVQNSNIGPSDLKCVFKYWRPMRGRYCVSDDTKMTEPCWPKKLGMSTEGRERSIQNNCMRWWWPVEGAVRA